MSSLKDAKVTTIKAISDSLAREVDKPLSCDGGEFVFIASPAENTPETVLTRQEHLNQLLTLCVYKHHIEYLNLSNTRSNLSLSRHENRIL